jgi:hypothetical protein
MTKTIAAMEALIAAIDSEIKDEPDDFDWGLVSELRNRVGRDLYHLTRGELGIPNHLELKVI